MASVLMQVRFRDAVADGTVTLTFRRWKRPQVVPGRTYRTAAGRIVVEAVDVVDPAITTGDARARVATRRASPSCADRRLTHLSRPVPRASTV
jgi:hypothetical protein